MAFRVKGGGAAVSDINVTPLVDVMLVLLIIFMVTATLTRTEDEQERRVDMNLPQTRTDPPPDPSQQDRLILRVDEQLQVSLNGDPMVDCARAAGSTEPERFEPCLDEIQAELEANPRVAELNAVFVLGEMTVSYGFIVGILHRIRVAGVDRVGMVTNPAFLTAALPTGGTE